MLEVLPCRIISVREVNHTIQVTQVTNSSYGQLVVRSEITLELVAVQREQMVVYVTDFLFCLARQNIWYPGVIPGMVSYYFQEGHRFMGNLFRHHQAPLIVAYLRNHPLFYFIGRNE